MKTKKILKVSLIISIIGLFLLIFLVENYFLNDLTVHDIQNNKELYLNKKISIFGFIVKEDCYDNNAVFDCYFKIYDKIENNSRYIQAKGTFFQDEIKKLNEYFDNNINSKIVLNGILKEYNNELYLEILNIKT